MGDRLAVQIEARRWINTPYRHQHRLLGHGVDCIGLVWGVGEACGILPVDPVLARPFLAYSRSPNPTRMRKAMETFFHRVEGEPLPGDIPFMAWDREREIPQHLGILAEWRGQLTLIHAASNNGKVVEHGFLAEWPDLVESYWRYPGLG